MKELLLKVKAANAKEGLQLNIKKITTKELHNFKADEEESIVKFSIPWVHHQPKGRLQP